MKSRIKNQLLLGLLVVGAAALFSSFVYFRYFVPDKQYKCINGDIVLRRDLMLAIDQSEYKMKSIQCDERNITGHWKEATLQNFQAQIDSLEQAQK